MSEKVFLCRIDGNFGGVERHILSLAKGLSETPFSPIIVPIANHGELERQSKELNIPTLFLPMKSRLDISGASNILLEMIKQHNGIVLHTFGIRSNSLAWKIRKQNSASWAARVPNFTCTDYSNPLIGKISHWINNRFLRNTDSLHLISPQLKQYYQSIGFPENKISLIPNGVDLEHYQLQIKTEDAKQNLNFPSDAFVIGSVGRLAPIKGYDVLLKSFAKLKSSRPNTYLVLVGDGPEKDNLKQLARQLQIDDSVRFTGFIEDIRPALWSMDLYVCSSHSEGVPHTVLEAMAASVPVVSTRVGGIESIISNNECGILLDSLNVDVLTKSIFELMQNTDLRNTIKQNGLEKIKSAFTENKMVERVVSMYERILNKDE